MRNTLCSLFLIFSMLIFTCKVYACSCAVGGSFDEMAQKSNLVLRTKIVEYGPELSLYPNEGNLFESMLVEVIDIYKGEYIEKTMRIFGDTGALCSPYIDIDRFKIGNEYLFALYITENIDKEISDILNEDQFNLINTDDNPIYLSSCGDHYILLEDNVLKSVGLYWEKFKGSVAKIKYTMTLDSLLETLGSNNEVEIIKEYYENGQLTTEGNYIDDDLIDKTELDEVYRKDIVGYWVNSNDMSYATGVYLADGINRVLVYESINSKNLIAKIEAKWWIQNGHLFSKLIKMIPMQPGYYVGHIMEDKIVEINEKQMILINENGREEINYRNEDTNFDQLWEESVEEAREQKRGLWKDDEKNI